MNTSIVTDSSTIAVFDLEVLRYMVSSDGDWWTNKDNPEYIAATNRRELIVIDTGSDGLFNVSIRNERKYGISSVVKSESGKLYFVCGEEIPGDNLIPELIRGGALVSVDVGMIKITVSIVGSAVDISWENVSQPPMY